jgi:hypothetical protein
VSDHRERDSPPEKPLPGGFVGDTVLVDGTVRKRPPRDADFVRQLLRHFEERGWDGAPRFLGTDGRGREVLSFVDGVVPWGPGPVPASIRSEHSLAEVARQVRRFHDLTAGSVLAGHHEVVCHNDLSPKNTVYRDADGLLLPVAFIDWDMAGPGERIHDVAHVCWQYVDLGPAVSDVSAAARLVRVIADAYGLENRSTLIHTIMWWQERCRRGIEAAADNGDAAMIRLRDLGNADAVRASHEWTHHHRGLLEQALVS